MYLRYFATARALTDGEIEHFVNAIQPFLGEWTSHNRQVLGDLMVYENRFVQLRASLMNGETISGCGIDKGIHAVEQIAAQMGVKWANPLDLFVKSGNELYQFNRTTLKEAIQAQKIHPDDVFFDLSATAESQLTKKLGDTVFKRYFEVVA